MSSSSTGFSLLTGVIISFSLSLLYVIALYINKKKSINDEELDRDDPLVVESRIRRISILTIIVILGLPVLLSKLSGNSLRKIISELGILVGFSYQDDVDQLTFDVGHLNVMVKDAVLSQLLVYVLFAGPLLDYSVVQYNNIGEMYADYFEQLSTLHGLRDLLIGPFTEEAIYTSAIVVTLFQVPDVSINLLIFLPPVFFCVAHVHHAISLYQKNIPFKVIIISTLFQMLYTFLFGIFTNFVFLRTNNVWACFIVHSFCNFMGVPSAVVHSKSFKYWNYVYYALLALGIYGFKKLLFPLTGSSLSLVDWE